MQANDNQTTSPLLTETEITSIEQRASTICSVRDVELHSVAAYRAAHHDIPRLIAHIRALESRLNNRQQRLNEIGYAHNWTAEMLAAYEVGYEEGESSVEADRARVSEDW